MSVTRKRRPWPHVAVATLAIALAAGACGGSGSSESSPSSTSSTSQAGNTTSTTGAAPARPLRIVVTNDDGYAAEGIDLLVEALRKLPDVEVHVVAPATDQTGAGGKTTPGPLTHREAETRSGFPAVAVDGHPADTVRVAVDDLELAPDVVVSGVNQGQNVGPLVDVSGTVGAARAAAARGIPAVAVSQGVGEPVDYAVAVKAAVKWITDHRDELRPRRSPLGTVTNINAPSCGDTGSPRGTIDVPLAPALRPLKVSDCGSKVADPADDMAALDVGFIVVAPIPARPAPAGS